MYFKTKIKSTIVAAALLALGTIAVGDARADGHLEGVVKARQGYFQLVVHNAGTLFGMAQGKVDYDAERAQAAADNLVMLTNMHTSSLWVPGTSKEEMPGKTRALKKIWEPGSDIGDKAAALKKAAADMADFAGTGLDAIKANASALGGACKGCHDNYRAENF